MLHHVQVQVDASELSGFSVSAPEVVQHYKYKNMKAALANIPAGKDIGGSVSTKVGACWQCEEALLDSHGCAMVCGFAWCWSYAAVLVTALCISS